MSAPAISFSGAVESAVSGVRNLPETLRGLRDNPVVVRDLRSQMRGVRAYWYIGAYLLLLGLLSITGYGVATGQGLNTLAGTAEPTHLSVVQAQAALEGLHTFIFMTLAALICLIAPALTASSVVGERQRLSLDLLITTPLRSGELLIGKLLSSLAFLLLLLTLSLPATTLCVLLGGATFADTLRVYGYLIVDALVLSGIGLYFSCAVRTNLLSILWTYATVAVFLIGTALGGMCITGSDSPLNHHRGEFSRLLLSGVGMLNPFFAVGAPLERNLTVGPLAVVFVLCILALAALALRLLLTAGAFRLRMYGGSAGPSLRRQILLISGLLSALYFCLPWQILSPKDWCIDSCQSGITVPMVRPDAQIGWMMILFFVASPFLAGLFVPASADDAPPGTPEETAVAGGRRDRYRFRAALLPYHAGALPYYHLWLLVVTVSALVSIGAQAGWLVMVSTLPLFGVSLVYLLAMGFLLWGIARAASARVKALSGARALTFVLLLLLTMGPVMILALTPLRDSTYLVAYGTLLGPLGGLDGGHHAEWVSFTLSSSGIAVLLGFAFLGLERLRTGREEALPGGTMAAAEIESA